MTKKSGNSAKYFMSRRSMLASGLVSSLLMAAMPVAALAKSAKTAAPSPNANDKQGNAGRPDVYLLRGFANIFSTGIDEIGADLQAAGVDAHVEGNAAWRLVANRIISDRQKYGPQPVTHWAPMPLFPLLKFWKSAAFAWIIWRLSPRQHLIPCPGTFVAS
jgi:hypothetical protein